MAQDPLQRAKETYADVKEAWRDNHQRMKEDLRFSNPVDPQQWDDDARRLRKDRVCLTLDRTNQYIVQVVNGGRMNRPSINVMPADSRADIAVANALDGIIRHIEYRSRAAIAYDWALEGAARCGVGWLRVVPRVMDPMTNQQEICIDRVADHLSIVIDGNQPDGSDAMHGFAETLIPKKRFERMFPGKDTTSWSADGVWKQGDDILICEYQYVVEAPKKLLSLTAPEGDDLLISEDDYRELSGRLGYEPPITREIEATTREVKWCKFNGNELLEETALPGNWIGMVPVIGFEAVVEGERFLCGVTRRMMESQRAYNYERSALVETIALQPKAPLLVAAESTEGHEEHFANLNTGQPAYLPYNALDTEGRPLPVPQRLAPPSFPTAFAQGGQMAVADMEAAIGMFANNLGAPNNATSGKQERERKQQGQVSTFHFADNQSRSIEHLGRIVVGMIPTLYDTKRQAKILGMDGQQSSVEIDPEMPQAAIKKGKRATVINPGVGSYDVRVKTGPSYTTQREEAAEGITAILQAAPQLTPILAPELARMRDWPNSEKIARALTAMAPPEVQKILGEDDAEEAPIPPEVTAQMQKMQQEGQQMAQMLDAAQAELQRMDGELQKAQQAIQANAADAQAKLDAAQIAAQGRVQEAQIAAEAQVAEAQIKGQAEVAVASVSREMAQTVQPMPEATEPREAEPGALALIVPALMGIQQQLGQLAAQEAREEEETDPEPCEVSHVFDPATGLLAYSHANGMGLFHERDPQTGRVIRSYQRALESTEMN